MKDRQDKSDLIDKHEWERGVWHGEPDLSTWTDEKTGYQVKVARLEDSGALCFQVGVPPDHAAHGQDLAPAHVVDGLAEKGLDRDGAWWFGYRFDRQDQGRPGQKMNLSMYRSMYDVQSAATRLCTELAAFDKAAKVSDSSTDGKAAKPATVSTDNDSDVTGDKVVTGDDRQLDIEEHTAQAAPASEE